MALIFRMRLSRRLPVFYHRLCTRLLGFEVVVRGHPVKTRPVLFVGNHMSYLDIMVLASVLEVSFVAKAEIARWPLFGLLAKLQRTVFIERRGLRAAEQRDAIAERLAEGDALILFPEGTSSDGVHVLPFKSALFAVAERQTLGRPLVVQPFSLTYTHIDGLPVGRDWQPLIAWYGEMPLPTHMWRVLSLASVRVEVRFHEPVTIERFGSRKALAEHCHHDVALGVIAARHGAAPEGEKATATAPLEMA